jgi:putative salt-induced outer membrane protein YdiY
MKTKFALVLVSVLLAATANADELIMKNGSRLIGKLISAGGGTVVLDTPFAGQLNIKSENIESITTDESVTVMMKDGEIFREKQIVATASTVEISNGDTPRTYPVTDIDLINPEPWLLGEGYKWFGKASTALAIERGNTDTDELDVSGESIWRSLVDRYTVRGSYERDEANGEKNKNQWTLRSKYDRFRQKNPSDYYGIQVYFKHDEFADLDLRTGIGPYIGRQFYESSLLSLSGEIGLVYVDEQFDVAEDNDFVGGNWELRLTSDIIPRTEFYVNQDGVLNFDDADSMLVNTTIGLGLPIIYGVEAALEAKFEYDGGAVEGVDEWDQTYSFRLGYKW